MKEVIKINKTPTTLTPMIPIKRALKRPDVYREFIIWMSVFEPLREPKTQKEFAEKFGVSKDTLTDWKKRNDFWTEVEREWKKWGREKTANVMSKLYNTIMQKGENPNFRLWLQYFQNWGEKNGREIATMENVWQFDQDQEQASDILGEMIEAAEDDRRAREFLEGILEADLETIKDRISAPGFIWKTWWKEGVDRFIAMQKEENNLMKIKK